MAAKQTTDPDLSSEKWFIASSCSQHLQEDSDKHPTGSDVFPDSRCPLSKPAQLPAKHSSALCDGTSYDAENTDALLRALTDELAVAVKGITAPNPSFCPSAKGFSLHRNVPRRTYSECNLSHHMELTYEKVATFSPIEKRKEKMCHRIMEMVVGSQNLTVKHLKHPQRCQAEVQPTTQCEFTYLHW